jgi:hypothetical protein
LRRSLAGPVVFVRLRQASEEIFAFETGCSIGRRVCSLRAGVITAAKEYKQQTKDEARARPQELQKPKTGQAVFLRINRRGAYSEKLLVSSGLHWSTGVMKSA